MSTEFIVCLVIAAIAIVVNVIVGFCCRTKCPYCGSADIKMKKIDATLNYARWTCICKKCRKEFYIE